ncbi:Protein of unknown function [Cotesia congregata]|uniref:Uncharacterized protein n=1 Tax=Cotesia congregata TaxID=51543 RepID=A0A8J2MW32_COTCN|nr:Protein of unknown function [Cotesia congregata]
MFGSKSTRKNLSTIIQDDEKYLGAKEGLHNLLPKWFFVLRNDSWCELMDSLLDPLQNAPLNKHLAYVLIDQIVLTLFPELSRPQSILNITKELSNNKSHEPVEETSAASSDTLDLRQPADGVDPGGVVDLHVEVDSEDEGSKTHGNAGDQEQHSPAKSVDNQRADEDSDHLHGSNDDCRYAGVQGASSGFEDGARVENNRVDSAELLEEHQPESDHQSLNRRF